MSATRSKQGRRAMCGGYLASTPAHDQVTAVPGAYVVCVFPYTCSRRCVLRTWAFTALNATSRHSGQAVVTLVWRAQEPAIPHPGMATNRSTCQPLCLYVVQT